MSRDIFLSLYKWKWMCTLWASKHLKQIRRNTFRPLNFNTQLPANATSTEKDNSYIIVQLMILLIGLKRKFLPS